jgi:hypothetical protein
VIKTEIAAILVLALIGILVYYTAASQAYAAGGLMGLVAHGSQDVYLTGQPVIKFKQLQSQVNYLRSEENKTQSEVNKLQSEENKLQSEVNKLQSDLGNISKTH